MTITVAPVWPLNELGEIVVELGTGTNTVTGLVNQDLIPTKTSNNKAVLNIVGISQAITQAITGFVAGAGTVAATDTILQAFNKVVGNIALKADNLLTGFVSGAGTVAATDTVLQAFNKLNGNVALKANAANAALTGNTSTQAVTLNTRVHVAAGDVTVSTTDHVIVVTKTSGEATNIPLPAGVLGRTLVIKDGKGDALTNNITLTPAAGTIDGGATFVLNLNRQSATIVYDGTEWEVI